MLIYQMNDNPSKTVEGDQITAKSIQDIAHFVGGSCHTEVTEDIIGNEHTWIEIIKGSATDEDKEVTKGEIGDYFITENHGDTFTFIPKDEFESQYTEQYDPEKDGDENRYFNPDVDIRRTPVIPKLDNVDSNKNIII